MKNKGISLISLIITIIVVIILAAIAIFTGFGAVDQAGLAKFTGEFSDFQTAVDHDYLARKQEAALSGITLTNEQHYYMIAKGIPVNGTVPASSDILGEEVEGIDEIKATLSEELNGDKYFEITSDTNVKGWNSQKKYLSVGERHYITNIGEVFIVPGYEYKDKDGSKFYITAGKYTGAEVEVEDPAPVDKKITNIALTNATVTSDATTSTINLTITPSDATNKTVTWQSSDENVVTVANGVVTYVGGGRATITATATDGSGKSGTCEVISTQVLSHTDTSAKNWELIGKIAKEIAKSASITSDSNSATVDVDGSSYTINVGDTFKVAYKTAEKVVRVMGFNHDTLANTSAYGADTTVTKAGISFEFKDILISTQGHSERNTTGGWVALDIYKKLNTNADAAINDLSNKAEIKAVVKTYGTAYNSTATSISNDKLWLLACSEIWNDGFDASTNFGYALANEGPRYKFYKNINAKANVETPDIIKASETGNSWWTLRSLPLVNSERFAGVNGGSAGYSTVTNTNLGMAPGFCI